MIIIHRCTKCAHPDIFHNYGSCCYSWCRCPDAEVARPEIIPTWDTQLVEEITRPGTRTREYGVLCGCLDCQRLYREAT